MVQSRLKVFLFLLLSCFASTTLLQGGFGVASADAQTKVGYIDASKLLKHMSEAVDAESRLGQLVSSWTHEADDMQNELTRKTTEFDRRKLIMTDAERSAFELDIQNLKKKLDDYRQAKYGQNGELYTQQAQLMKPAYEKLQKAIEELARDGSYDYVLDRSSRDVLMLFANAKYDLTLAAARKLNIETDGLTQPLINNAPNPNSPNQQNKPSTNNGQPIQKPMDGSQPGQPPPLPNGSTGGPGGGVVTPPR